ncbi:MAG: helix-turn-helix transcriptional regulator [Ruminococcaceae bacterium]|nr:helix-turn-helix transcriptional regulator [Oscillospiraceae bacterium]
MHFAENICVLSCVALSTHYRESKSYSVPAGHVHTLTFRTEGTKIIHIQGYPKPFVSPPGSITFIPKEMPYSVEAHSGGHMYAVHLFLARDCAADPFVFLPQSPIVHENGFRRLCECCRGRNGSDYRCLAVLYDLFAQIEHECSAPERHAVPKRIRDVMTYVNRNFDNPSLSVSELAERAGISEVYLRREFRMYADMTPHEYIRKVRLENAQALLSTALYSISEVATRCGFDSISYFSDQFRRIYGISPSVFRNSSREES